MDLQHTYSVEEILEIINTMNPKDKETLKSISLSEEAEFERFLKEDFTK